MTHSRILFLLCVFAQLPLFAHNSASFLGLEDASENYRYIAQQALKDFNVTNFDTIPIKKVGGISKYILGNNTLSFTLYGIWVDEDLLAAFPKQEIIFTLYEEAAHYVLRHHAKLLLSLIPSSFALWAFSHGAARAIGGSFIRKALTICLSGAGLIFGIDRYMMSPIIRSHEKEAELAAARVLCKVQKHEVVFGHIDYLQNLLSRGEASSDCWWHTTSERIKYMKEFMQTQEINV